jgi:acyl-CoA thioester hydrolase
MPLTHTRTFRIRHYECDTHGRVYHANYLRYMQETAFDASAAAGYDMARYEAMGRFWLVRETNLEVFRPLFYDEQIEVKTWIADFRHVHSQRAYELSLAGTDRLVARATTDWAFLDSATGYPAIIPDEMVAAFVTAGAQGQRGPRDRFPSPPPAPLGAFRARRRVQWRDLDPAGHVNNAVYLAYFEDCAVQAAEAHGWPPGRLEAAGAGIHATHHRIDYRQPALLDDELEVIAWLSDAQPSGAIWHFDLRRTSDDVRLARARTRWQVIDLVSGEPRSTPGEFLADLQPAIAAPGS